MKYKMVVLDLDDTLLDKDHTISEKTITTLNKLRDMDVEIVVATGRMYCSALPYIKQLGLVGEMITYNGAYIRDVDNDEVIYHQPIEVDIAREILKQAEEADLFCNIYIEDKIYVKQLNEKSDLYKSISGIESNPVGKLSEFIDSGTTKLLIIERDLDKAQKYKEIFKEKYGDVLEITKSKEYFIEFMARGVSKGRAIEVVADNLGISLDEVIAIGDSWNDIEMIQTAGLGIAMGNAHEDVKIHADRIADTHDKDGVSNILSEIFEM
ncbi:MAG: Cof-type HAD-IIB family hydrolase [Halanaerobiaceae bacterium]